ncbi:uncharacterized protein OCT59_009373 [Rhizophagus irregularis]|uniref:uncharacterized protein n=1 Tax=Rhizophagus irregularis TaxID=588596 RepID=UPI00332B11C4|nr:hypothetical protein OCT59_009373 [Rhizophagus irregularis]
MHKANIIHKDYHSGNIFIEGLSAVTGDLGLNKSSFDDDDDNEIYECWNPDPKKRPTATDIGLKIYRLWLDEGKNPCKIVKSQDIGPITNNPGAIYKSRHLSKMVKSAESTRTLGFSKSCFKYIWILRIIPNFISIIIDNTIKKLNYLKIKILSFKFDIDENVNSIGFNSDYVTREIEFDI